MSVDKDPWHPPLRRLESVDDLTPDEVARLGRVMARLVFTAWLATRDSVQQSENEAES